MPRPNVEWNPNQDNDAVRDWVLMEPDAYQDVITGLTGDSLEDVSVMDWEEANSYAEKGPHIGRTHRS